MQSLCPDSRVLVDGGHLYKADTDGVEKTANAMSQRWDAANKHLNERQNKWVEFSDEVSYRPFLHSRPIFMPGWKKRLQSLRKRNRGKKKRNGREERTKKKSEGGARRKKRRQEGKQRITPL